MPGPAIAVPARRRPWWRGAAAVGPALVVLVAGTVLAGCGIGATPGDTTDTAGTAAGDGTGSPAALAAAVAVRATGCRQAESLTGSGSVVGDDLVVTVAHVVAGSTSVAVIDADGSEHTAVVVALDTVNDLALLAVAGLDVAPLPLGTLATADRAVFVVHDDDGRAMAQPATVIRRADLSMADLYGEGSHLRPGFELDATVNPGDSGAVVVGDDGRAGAVVFATSREGATPAGPAPTGPAPTVGAARRAWATDIAVLDPLLAGPLDAPVPTGRCVA